MTRSEKFWDWLSKRYDSPEKIKVVNEYKSVEYAKKYLKTDDIALDFGCATGTTSSLLAGKVKEMHGIDISSKMIRIAKERASERKIENIFFSRTTIFDEKYNREKFNAIMAFSILHLVEDTEKTIQRIYELLKPGGHFISLTPCIGEKTFLRALLLLVHKIGILPYIKCLKISELEEIIENENFEFVEKQCLDNNPLEFFFVVKKL